MSKRSNDVEICETNSNKVQKVLPETEVSKNCD